MASKIIWREGEITGAGMATLSSTRVAAVHQLSGIYGEQDTERWGNFTGIHLTYVHPPAAPFSRFYEYCLVHVQQAPTQVLQQVQILLVYGSTSFVRGIGMARVATGHFHLCKSLAWWIIGEITSILMLRLVYKQDV